MAGIGRQVKYGIGAESTPGTAVAASHWINQLSFSVNPVTTTVNNESAWGNNFRTNNTNQVRKHVEGELEAKLTSDTSGIILLGAFGNVNSVATTDTSGDVFAHAFTISEDINGQSLTLVRQDAISTKAYALGRIGEWTLSVELDDYIKYTASIMAKAGVATAATPAYTEETEFLARHFTVNTGGANHSTVESFTVTVNPNLEADNATGSNSPYGFSSRGFEASFEMTCRYDDTTFEDAYNDTTQIEMNMLVTDTSINIGTNSHPSLAINASRAFITDWTRNEDNDGPVTQTMTGTIHYSPAEAEALRAVLINTTPDYL